MALSGMDIERIVKSIPTDDNSRELKITKLSKVYAPAEFTFEGRKDVVAILFCLLPGSSVTISMGTMVDITVDGITINYKVGDLKYIKNIDIYTLMLDFSKINLNTGGIPDVGYLATSNTTINNLILNIPYSFRCKEGFTIKADIQYLGNLLSCYVIYK